MLRIANLFKSFGPITAVHGISMEVHKGEVVGLLGPNGAGKTTTMRLVTGFLTPDTGEIEVAGIDVLRNPREARRAIGYLPENAPSYHDMEVLEFLTYMGRLRQMPAPALSGALRETMALCGLAAVAGRTIGHLSRGYKQRVCLAQALLHKPKLLILDEPTTGLDPHQIQEIRTLIREIGKERTVILSTHIMQEVQAVCSRAFIISRGRLAGEGTLDELLRKGKGGNRYSARIKAAPQAIEGGVEALSGFALEDLHPYKNGSWQEVTLSHTAPEDKSEEIFRWVVERGWSLAELKCETASLEEVFLELTQK